MFHYALRPHGFLLLGNSETIREFTDLFHIADRKHKFFARIDNHAVRAIGFTPRMLLPDTAIEGTVPAAVENWETSNYSGPRTGLYWRAMDPPE